ncbi:MAG TPA: TIGR01777 family oxidoreductase [Acidimicrobiales bacterium]|nr:TIGR01777 family oxidoreductase [Acidimicrobiales bacterium]
MRALITGSTGFVGAALARSLVERGVTVHPLVRRTAAEGEVGIDLAARHLDLGGLPGGDLREVDVVFNLAGEPLTPRRWGPAKTERIRSSRILTTDLVARAIATTESDRLPALVSMSAVGYYGDRGDELLDEDAAAGTGFLAEVCRSWEAATATARDAGARVVCCRSGVVLGPGGVLARQRPLFRAGLGGRLGSGRQWMSWVGLDDVLAALWHCATGSVSGAVNLCAPNPVRNSEFTTVLAGLVHRPSFVAVPRPLLRLTLGRRVTDELVLASQRCVPERLEASGFSFAEPDLAACLSSLEARRSRR